MDNSRRLMLWCGQLFCLLLLAGCGYHAGVPNAAGILNTAPSIVLLPFENQTSTPLLDIRMTELFREVLLAQGFRVISDPPSPERTLSGIVLRAASSPVAFTSKGQASAHRLTVGMIHTLRQHGHPPQDRPIEASATYQALDSPSEEMAARERAIREVGYRLATQIGQWLMDQQTEEVQHDLSGSDPALR